MLIIVLIVGVLIAGAGLALLVAPARLTAVLARLATTRNLVIVAVVRILLGGLLVLGAHLTRMADVIFAIGMIGIISGLTLPFFGRVRAERFVQWWAKRPPWFHKSWAIAAIGIGAFVMWTTF